MIGKSKSSSNPELMPLLTVRGALLAVAAVALPTGVVPSHSPDGVAITFLANEGVMLSSGTKKVLIDALFLKYRTGFAVPADSTRAALEQARAPFAPFRLDTARIDVALLPYWAVTSREGARVIERWIRPRQVVAFHVGEGEADEVSRAVRAAIPSAVTFARSLETRRW